MLLYYSLYLQSLILGIKQEPDPILSQVNHHVLIKGKLMQLGRQIKASNYEIILQTYLFTVLQLYVFDSGALLLEYLHRLSQRHTYIRGARNTTNSTVKATDTSPKVTLKKTHLERTPIVSRPVLARE